MTNVCDITKEVREEEMRMCSTSSGRFHSTDEIKLKATGDALDALAAKMRGENIPTHPKRVPQLSHTQVSPFVRNSTMKKVIAKEKLLKATYDPFEPVDSKKLNTLHQFIREHEEQPISTIDSEVEFCKIIITPRKEWSSDTYGWLAAHASFSLYDYAPQKKNAGSITIQI